MRLAHTARLFALLLPCTLAAVAQSPTPPPAPEAPLINQKAMDELRESIRKGLPAPDVDILNHDALSALLDRTSRLAGSTSLLALQDMGSIPFNLHFGGSPESRILPPGTWWRNPELATRLSLSADQQKRMDSIVLESKIQLVHIKATLEEEELRLDPLLNSNPPDSAKALVQINHIADTRADLEKANAKMLLSLRSVLTAAQWTQLQAENHHGLDGMTSIRTLRRMGPTRGRGPGAPGIPAGPNGPAAPTPPPAPGGASTLPPPRPAPSV